ncbi:MAG: GtrA family protein [Bacteroidia bacterium]|jgi:putative flippase GtrA|nr:GtrA family protein [Bacteroidia bacterium]
MIKIIHALRVWIRNYPFLHRFTKFGIVGVISTLASLFVFWLITLQYPQYNLPAKAIGYIMGFFVGFSLNKLWTYVDQTEDGERYLLKYIIVYGITFFVFLGFNFVCDHYVHPEVFVAQLLSPFLSDYWTTFLISNGPLVSNVLAIGVNVGMNFLGTNFLVFRVPDPKDLFD